jgi:hypothetical protein
MTKPERKRFIYVGGVPVFDLKGWYTIEVLPS